MSLTENLVTSVATLEALYDAPPWAAVAKETDTLIGPLPDLYRIGSVPHARNHRGGWSRLFAPWRRSGLCSNPGRQDDFDPQPEWQQPNREPA
jgi:hypothetical protein